MASNLKKNFNGTISREELKTDLCGLMISEMTFSNQSHFPRFFSPRKITGIWPIPAYDKPESAGPGKSSSGILGLERMRWLSFVILKDIQDDREKSRKVTLVGQSHRRNH
jgi:hypothetical protein